jgi:acyl transferase domain-containing protein/NAD(P)-dependent dehydrogenase (short-subunit alcohol dehydrogenase family)/acyl carrier protein
MNSPNIVQIPVAIVGMGCIFSKSPDLKSFFKLLISGTDAVTEPPDTHANLKRYFDPDPKRPDHIYCVRGGFLPPVDFDPTEFAIPPSSVEATDTSQLLGLLIAKQALEDAGYGACGRSFNREKTSVILGVTGTQELVIPLGARLGHPFWRKALAAEGIPPSTADAVVRHISESYVEWQENSFPGLLGNVVAGRIANRLDLGGTNCVVDAACASSMGALHMALLELASGRSEMVITGGVDTINDAFMHMCFAKSHILSKSGDIRPFSSDADGTVLGEGIGMVVLKRLADAQKDKDRIYAVIKGIGSASDGKSPSIYAPRIEGQALALTRAYTNAGVRPDDVDLIEAHGTGTAIGDLVEFQALSRVFGACSPNGNRCALGTVKSNIGHTKAAAGTAGIIKAALSIYNKVLPPTLKADPSDPKLQIDHSPFYLNHKLRPWVTPVDRPRRAGVSAFGFGGSNFHAVLEEYDHLKTEPSWDGSVEMVAFSGQNSADVIEKLRQWRSSTKSGSTQAISRLAVESRIRFKSIDPLRLVVVIEPSANSPSIDTICMAAENYLSEPDSLPHELNDRIFKGTGSIPGQLAFLFPGQGSQYVGMGRDVICCFPESLTTFQEASVLLGPQASLGDCVFPRLRDDSVVLDHRLRQTDIAQPAIGAVSAAMLAALSYFGATPEACCGHSYGELVALYAAGWISRIDLWKLSAARGKLMASAGADGADSGSMLAVKAPIAELSSFVSESCQGVILANRNAPEQGVLSGPTDLIESAARKCGERGWQAILLPVSAAFHSPMVGSAQVPFQDLVNQIDFSPTSIGVMSNSTGHAYASIQDQARKLLGAQLSQPVNFIDNIQSLYRDGARTFLEVGPKAVLTHLAKQVLSDKPIHCLAVDRSAGRNSGLMDLAVVLAALAALGYPVQLNKWEKPAPPVQQPRMRLSISGTNYRKEKPTEPDNGRSQPKPELVKATPIGSSPTVRPAPSSNTDGIINSKAATAPKTSRQLEPMPAVSTVNSSRSDGRTIMTQASQNPLLQALQAVQQGITTMQELQTQTTQAHQKFLDVQAETNRTLQAMVQGAFLMSGGPPQETSRSFTQQFQTATQPLRTETEARWKNDDNQPVKVETAVSTPLNTPSAGMEIPATAPSNPERFPRPVDHQPVALKSDAPVIGEIEQAVLGIVSELTGYPAEMLGLEMDIESDLGIDSIKRVEILSAVEEKMPDLPKVTPDLMGSLKTLGQICAFLASPKTSTTKACCASQDGMVSQSESAKTTEAAVAKEIQSALNRYVVSVEPIEPDGQSALELAKGQLIVVVSEQSPVADALIQTLTDRGLDAKRFNRTDELPSRDHLGGLVLIAPLAPLNAFQWVKGCAPFLRNQGTRRMAPFCYCVSFLDGAFGFNGGKITDPDQGALSGLLKTAALEWPDIRCRAIDIDPQWKDTAAIAQAIYDELGLTAAAAEVEIGRTVHGRYRLNMASQPLTLENKLPLNLSPQDVVVVTGGARGITAEAAVALAIRTHCRLALLGRSAAPQEEPEWLCDLQDESHIKKALLDHDFADLPKSPQNLEKAYQQRVANRQMLRTLSTLKSMGVSARYYSVDARDAIAMQTTFDRIRLELGPIGAVIHGAGVLQDRLIVEKTESQFAHVFGTKVEGLQNLLTASAQDSLRYLVLFSSISARLGNIGQADYAMANEVLNKTACQYARKHPNCKVLSINWGPWDGGMVTASLRRTFTQRGISLIDKEQGVTAMLAEMSESAREPVEVVIGGLLPAQSEVGNPAPTRKTLAVADENKAQPLTLSAHRDIDLAGHPVLESHYLDGRPVVPLALITEWLAHGAMHANPGLNLHGIDHMRLFKGIALKDSRKRIALMSGAPERRGDMYQVQVELRDSTGKDPQQIHSSATAILVEKLPLPPAFSENGHFKIGAPTPSTDEVYESILFHGPALRGLKEIVRISQEGMTAWIKSAPTPRTWMENPWRSRWIADPLVLDCAFQMAIIWCHEQLGVLSLPNYVAAYRQYCTQFPLDGVAAILEVQKATDRKMTGNFTFLNHNKEVVAQLKGFEALIDRGLHKAFGIKAA